MMEVLLRNTFLHARLRPCAPSRRAQSCPPEVFVSMVVALARQLEDNQDEARAAKARRACAANAKKQAAQMRLAEEQAILDMLEACRVEKIEELWKKFVLGVARDAMRRAVCVGREVRKFYLDRRVGFARRLCEQAEQDFTEQAVALVGAERVWKKLPRPRASVEKTLFKEIASMLFTAFDLHLMSQIGLLRERPDCAQIWRAEDPLQETAHLLA